MATDWALIVGIDRYPSAGVDPLEGSVADAVRFREWAIRPDGGNVHPDQAILVTCPAGENAAKPRLADILHFFDDLQDKMAGATGRRLYIYLSGHGISPTGQESVRNAALLMANAKAPNLWHSLPGNIWAEGARSAAVFREVVLIMDCCRDLKNNATVFPHVFGDPTPDGKDCRLIEAYATTWASKARELPFPPDNKKQGVFTHSLLEVLKAGKMNGALLKESVKRHLGKVLKDEKRAQEPEIGRDDELARIVFNEAAGPPRTPVTIRTPAGAPPIVESLPEGSGALQAVALMGWTRTDSTWSGTLEPGTYLVGAAAGGRKSVRIVAAVPEEVELP